MRARARALWLVMAVGGMTAGGAGHAAAADQPPLRIAQELTLDGLGIGPQTVFAAHGVAEVYFPPPVGRLALSGSLVRVFFSHSPRLAEGSAMLLAVDDQPLVSVPLTAGTAEGGVVETRVPPSLLSEDQPTRLQVGFDLRPASGASQADLYGRVDGQTLVHYELASAGGVPGLEAYPYSLLAFGAASPALGLLLPDRPEPAELAAGLRLLADVGRRAPSQRIRPQVVTTNQSAWLDGGGTGALLVGRLDRVPAGAEVLEDAGWRRLGVGWISPDGRGLRPDDGLVLATVSPKDHRTPLLLVTGGTDAALAKAAAGLAGLAPLPLAGPYLVVSAAPGGQDLPIATQSKIQLTPLSPSGLAGLGPGRYRVTESFTAPAVDPDDVVQLDLVVPRLGGSTVPTEVEADVNDVRVAQSALEIGGTRTGQLGVHFSGRLLRPGHNALSLDFRTGQPVPGATPAPEDALTFGQRPAEATVSLPLGGPRAADLRLLPFPFFEGSTRTPRVLLADAGPGTLAAAARAMVALGSRSTRPVPALQVSLAKDWDGAAETGSLIVVAVPTAGGPLDVIGAALPVQVGGSGEVTLPDARLVTPLGAVQEAPVPGDGSRQVLWLAGTGAAMLASAADAVYDPRLSGPVAVVDASGRLTSLSSAEMAAPATAVPNVGEVLIGFLALLLLGVLVLQLVRPKRQEPLPPLGGGGPPGPEGGSR